MMLELAADPGEFSFVESEDAVVGDKHDAMWITHRNGGDPLDPAAYFQREIDYATPKAGRNLAAGEDWLAPVHGCGDSTAAVDSERHSLDSAVGRDRERVFMSAGSFVIE